MECIQNANILQYIVFTQQEYFKENNKKQAWELICLNFSEVIFQGSGKIFLLFPLRFLEISICKPLLIS